MRSHIEHLFSDGIYELWSTQFRNMPTAANILYVRPKTFFNETCCLSSNNDLSSIKERILGQRWFFEKYINLYFNKRNRVLACLHTGRITVPRRRQQSHTLGRLWDCYPACFVVSGFIMLFFFNLENRGLSQP